MNNYPRVTSAFSLPTASLTDWTVYVDGATFGSNPALVGAGAFTVWCGGARLYYAESSPLLDATNNRAEFFAFTRALRWLRSHGLQGVTVYTDSDILSKWANGAATLKNPHLLTLARQGENLIYDTRVTTEWVPRTNQRLAFTDYLASYGGDAKLLRFSTLAAHSLLIGGYYTDAHR